QLSQQLLLRYADLAAETESWNYLASQPLQPDALLSVSRRLPDPAAAYVAVWESRAAIIRLQERRHRDLMASPDKETADLVKQLRLTRMNLAGLLLNPGPDRQKHREEVGKLTDAKEHLEKHIAAKLKLVPLKPATTSPKPKQLQAALRDGTVFVDLCRY